MRTIIIFLALCTCLCGFSQTSFDDILDNFEDFAELSREQIYVHLNKSTYVSNETIWFKSYIFSRDTQELSEQTTNLYCILLDANKKVVKEKMIMSVNGIGRGQFETDSTFTQGEYTFRAYTNWSKNFENERTHFEAKLIIINPEESREAKPISSSDKIDLQLLPESGHLLAGIKNRVGIIAKDSLGLGVANLKVNVIENEEIVNEILLNSFGIGAFEINPNPQSEYKVEFFYNNKKRSVGFPVKRDKGIVLSLEQSDSNLTVNVNTNTNTLGDVEGQLFKLTIHNSVSINAYDFLFQNKATQSFNFTKEDLFPGINIITLFNNKAEPIAERLYFNYYGLDIANTGIPEVKKQKDSILVSVPIDRVDANKLQSLSVSILPSNTKSYAHHSSIISSQLLEPYLSNPIQNAGYYFKDVDNNKKLELDLLLLTEGWSSYSWNTIFNNAPEYNYDLEVGVSYKLNTNSNETALYFIYPNFNTKTELVAIEGNSSIKKSGFFPLGNEDLRVGKLNKKKQLENAKLVAQFFPSKIPIYESKFQSLTSLESYQASNEGIEYTPLDKLNRVQELNEVTVTKKKEYTKIEKLRNKGVSKIIEFDEKKRRFYRTFGQFISSYGFYVEETPNVDPVTENYTVFRIFNNTRSSINASQVPTIFLDDVRLVDLNILSRYSMENIDYVEVNKSGVGEGMRGGAGVIRIYNKPIRPDLKYIERESYTSYRIPVTFDKPKTFYAPKYGSFETNFFKEYGVIDWKSKLIVKNGKLDFKVLDTGVPIKLCIEGVVNNKEFVSKEIELQN